MSQELARRCIWIQETTISSPNTSGSVHSESSITERENRRRVNAVQKILKVCRVKYILLPNGVCRTLTESSIAYSSTADATPGKTRHQKSGGTIFRCHWSTLCDAALDRRRGTRRSRSQRCHVTLVIIQILSRGDQPAPHLLSEGSFLQCQQRIGSYGRQKVQVQRKRLRSINQSIVVVVLYLGI